MLAAAARLFATHGYHNVTVDDIGAELGISGPALYHHFKSKEELLSTTLLSVNQGLVRDAAAAQDVDPRQTLRNLVEGLVTFSLDRPELIEIHKRELIHAPQDVQRQIRSLKASYVDAWVEPLISLGAVDDRTVRAAAQAVISLIISTPLSRDVQRSELASLLRDMAYGALGASVHDPELFSGVSHL